MSDRWRPRLARAVAAGRWREYRELLGAARDTGYAVTSLERWVLSGGGDSEGPTLVLRHDVDQHPGSALRMAEIEIEAGIKSTWYFRWRTAHPAVIGDLRDAGFEIGLHYETLSRRALADRTKVVLNGDRRIEECRDTLRREIATFAELFGPIRSICPHGDSRVAAVSNAVLLRGQDPRGFGIVFDGHEAVRKRTIGHWLTDRSKAAGGWDRGLEPLTLLRRRVTPILCVVHPNNWAGGPGLLTERCLRRAFPDPISSRFSSPVRGRADVPPI